MFNPFALIVETLCQYGGIDTSSSMILTCLLLAFPFSAIFKRLPDTDYSLKNYYILIVSGIYIFLILKIYMGFLVLMFNAMFTFLLTKYYKSRFMPWANLIGLLGFLAISHIKTQFGRLDGQAAEMDVTGAQMVLVMKLSAFAWSYWDGQLYVKDKEKFDRELSTYQKSRAIFKHPSFISYLGYVFFYASIVTGPSFDYSDYEKFILTDLFNDVPDFKKPGRRRKRKIPKSGRIALKKVIQGFFWIGLMMYLSPQFSSTYIVTDEFQLEKPFGYKLIFLWFLGFVERLKYNGVWLISEGACITAGLGYNGYDPIKKKLYWNRVQNIDPLEFEFGQNVHDCLEAWNMNTNKWLKNCVYLRTCSRDKKTGKLKTGLIPTFLTFFTSAFWHGTLPGYYLTFIIGAFIQTVGKIFRRNFRPMFISKDNSNISPFKKFYDILCWIITQLTFGYCIQPFILLRLGPSIALWSSCYFWVHIGCAIVIFIFNGPFGKQISQFLKQYHLQPIENKKSELLSISTDQPDISIQLAKLKDQFDSTTDLLDVIQKGTNASSSTDLPEYDNQEELKSTIPEFYDLHTGLDKLAKEMNEWKEQSLKGKETSQLTEEELLRLKSALSEFENDINGYLNNVKK